MKSLGKLRQRVLRRSLRLAGRWPGVRRLLDEHAIRRLATDPEALDGGGWRQLDLIYSQCRRRLHRDPAWRHGPPRIHAVAGEALEALEPHTRLRDKVYCDLGCGAFHPFGISTVMYLNGAASTIALDLQPAAPERAAEALADLLCDCLADPDRWHFSDIEPEEVLRRARRFDLAALRAGRLAEGIGDAPLQHVLTDIHDPELGEEVLDVISSRGVLEHFLDFRVAAERLFALTRRGGVAYHHIDVVDHRAYSGPGHHYWSYMAEDEGWSDGVVNRLRPSELRASFEDAGFEILRWNLRIGEMPEDFRPQIRGRYRGMAREDLDATGVFCVVRKP